MLKKNKMKIAVVHNDYGVFSGEESVVKEQVSLLLDHGHEVVEVRRSSAELKGLYGKIKGFLSGIYNPFSVRKFARFLDERKPDIVHIHNLYPLITPWILPEAKKRKIPVVMTLHNFRLVCPKGLFFQNGKICEECPKHSRFRCIKNNCADSSLLKSIGYAIRDATHSKLKLFYKNVDAFLCLTSFQKNKLIGYGLPQSKCHVIPNFIPPAKPFTLHSSLFTLRNGDYVAYAGRLSEEKGIGLIMDAARQLPEIKFKLAGHGAEAYIKDAPDNVEFTGHLAQAEFLNFMKNAKFKIMASGCYEGFPTSLLAGMSQGLPSIVPNLGAMPEIIEGCGIVFEANSSDSLRESIKKLWNDESLCRELGMNALKKCTEEYSSEPVYKKLMSIYQHLKLEV